MAIFSHKGIHYHVSQWGDKNNPPLVLLHGFAQSSQTWEPIAERLAEHRFVVAPDFIGHGKTDKPDIPESYEMSAMLDAINGLMRWLWADRIDLVGYSMGGRIALTYACAMPHHVASLVLESAALGSKTEQQHQAMMKRNIELIERLSEQSIEEFMDEWEQLPIFESQRRLPEEVKRSLRKARCANDTRALALTLRGTGQHTMSDLSWRINKLSMPIMYIAGILDRRYVKVAEQLQRNENVSCVLLNAGHNTHLEAPDAFVHRVNIFLRNSSPLIPNQHTN